MNKTRVAAVALSAALLSIFGASAANAAYAPPAFSADVENGVAPGEEFTIDFSSGGVDGDWTAEFEGQTSEPGSGETYEATFTAPEEDGTYTATAAFTWDPATASTTSTATPASSILAAPQTDFYSVQVVVGDGGDDSGSGSDSGSDNASGALPDTGGSNLGLIAAGAGLVVVGAGVAAAARRRGHTA